MKNFQIKYQKCETVWTENVCTVPALSAEDALQKVMNKIEELEDPSRDFNGVVLGICEYVDDNQQYEIDTEQRIEEVEAENFVTYFSMGIFDIARYEKQGLYTIAEESFNKNKNYTVEIEEMELYNVPSSQPCIDEVSIKAVITDCSYENNYGEKIRIVNGYYEKIYKPKASSDFYNQYEYSEDSFWISFDELKEYEIDMEDVEVYEMSESHYYYNTNTGDIVSKIEIEDTDNLLSNSQFTFASYGKNANENNLIERV